MFQVICKTYRFNDEIPIEKQSIFNPVAIKESEISITDYLILNESNFLISFTKSILNRQDNNLLSLQNEAGEVSFKLSGIHNNDFLQNYFLLYDTSGIIQKRIYEINIIYEGKYIWYGVTRQSDISISANKEIITLRAISVDKEFKSYYSTVKLLPHEIIFTPDKTPVPWKFSLKNFINRDNAVSVTIGYFLTFLLNDSEQETMWNVEVTPSINFWRVNNIPQMFKWNPATNNWWIKSGYAFFQRADYSVYELISYMFNCMGWKFLISKNQEFPNKWNFSVSNRNEEEITPLTIDFNDSVLDYNLNFVSSPRAKYIVIKDGHYKTGTRYASQGLPFAFVTEQFQPINETRFFGDIHAPNHPLLLIPWEPYGQRYQILNANPKTSKLDYAEVYYTGRNKWSQRVVERKFIDDNYILFIDGGSHSYLRVDTETGSNDEYNEQPLPHNGIMYHGNVGSMLFRSQPNYNYIIWNWTDYTRTDLFKNNFIDLLESYNSQLLEMKIKGIINSDRIKFYNISGTNSQINFFSKNFLIVEKTFDLINNTTNLIILRQ